MVDEQTIVESLSPIERKVLPVLTSGLSLNEIVKKSDVDKTTALRALEFLKKKNLVELRSEKKQIVEAGINGIFYLKKQLPERRLLLGLDKKKKIPISQIKSVVGLNENEVRIAIGVLKKKAFVEISNGNVVLVANKDEIGKKMFEEIFLESLPRDVDSLEPEEKFALKNLQNRKDIVQVVDSKEVFVEVTDLGKTISKGDLDAELIEQLTPKMIKSSSWKGKKFRRYDVISHVPKIYGGKKHFVNQSIEHAKKIWLEMGFKEMSGNLVQTGFWNFDALFTAQDHPVREEHDTFFIKDIVGKLPEDKKLIEDVKGSHEGGSVMVGGKSKGWQSEWDEEDAKKVLLRTHTTCLSAQTLKKVSENLHKNVPAKYFALGKCFRNETVDWSHGFEFNQTEGIVIDENANFRQLLGYLVEFFKKMGYEKIRIRPGYFPYTEPSLEIDVFHPERECWVELGGAGMFRPEVTIPMFGKHIPVLAWGPGFDRIIMEYFEITDLRQMYKNDISKLREMKFWGK